VNWILATADTPDGMSGGSAGIIILIAFILVIAFGSKK
jgi:hypothetical protein